MKTFCRYWLPVILLAAAIFLQSAFPSPEMLPLFPFADKLLHGLAYGLLAALCYRALRRASPMSGHGSGRLTIMAIVMATAYGASDEWHQSFIAARQADLFDLLADFVGSSIGAVAYDRMVGYLKPLGDGHSVIDKISNFL